VALPEYPEFAPLGMEHKAEIDGLFATFPPAISEFTFTNLFMWRRYYNIEVSRRGGLALFLARPAGKEPFFFPAWGPGDACDATRDCLEFLSGSEGRGHFERVPNGYVASREETAEEIAVTPDPANDDYVYRSQDLIALAGRKYDGKRNAIRKFQKDWTCEYRTIDRELARRCRELEDYWCVERQCALYPGLAAEEAAIRELFANHEALGVRGGAVLVDGRVAAFSVGEKLNADTFVVHVEKADLRLPGLYAVVNQEFIAHEASGYTYVNREQDLGEEGLRKAKQSYNPAHMVHKFKLALARNVQAPG